MTLTFQRSKEDLDNFAETFLIDSVQDIICVRAELHFFRVTYRTPSDKIFTDKVPVLDYKIWAKQRKNQG